MKKIKNYIKNHKTISIVLIIAIIIAIGMALFLAISYGTEKDRYDAVKKYCNNDSFAIQTEYELDKQEHEINVDNLVVANMPNYNSVYADRIGVGEYNRSFVGNNKFVADKVKKETYTIRTEIPKNKIWNKFKCIDTDIEVSCIDTTVPEFTEKVDSITINKGEEFDVVSKFNATDLSGEVKITVDGTIDVNTVGTQTVNIFATDESGNVAQTEVNVIVNEPEKNEATGNNNNETASKSNSSASTSQKSSSKKSTSSSSKKSNNTGNNKTSSNSNKNNSSSSTTSSASKPNNNGGSTTTTSGCASGNHSMPTGNIGKWFNSRNEVENYVISVSNMWEKKYSDGIITWEEKCANCPQGYEAWSCSRCGKWTGNFKY